MTNTRRFNPAYMNTILLRWNEKGLHSLQEILQKDRPPHLQTSASGPSAEDPGQIWERVKQI